MRVVNGGLLRVVASDVIAYDAPGLNDGIRFGYVHAGTLIYDFGMFAPTAFDGTTPRGEIGLFQGGDTRGLFDAIFGSGSLPDLSAVDSVARQGALASAASPDALAAQSGSVGYLPYRVTVAGPLYVVASRDGTKGGTAIGGTVGELAAWVHVAG